MRALDLMREDHSDPEVAGRLDLVPLSPWNLAAAVCLAKKTLIREWKLVALTYVWHLLRERCLPLVGSLVHRRALRLGYRHHAVGRIEVMSTRVHEPDIRWVRLECAEGIPPDEFCSFLFRLMPECRVALLLTAHQCCEFEDLDWVSVVGELPRSDQSLNRIYSARRSRAVLGRETQFWVEPEKAREEPGVKTWFYLIRREGQLVGLTGLYTAEWWPDIGWGGWGAIDRRFARLHTGVDALLETERLAAEQGKGWFCLETSGSPDYRVARRLYEHCGLLPLLVVENFFLGGTTSEERTYIVYGKRLGNASAS